MKNLKFFVIIFLDELGLLLSILGFFKDFLEISLISLISANLPLPLISTAYRLYHQCQMQNKYVVIWFL